MDSATLLEKAKAATDTATVRRVFGEPVERDGVVLLPVAKVSAGGGGGAGSGSAVARGEKDTREAKPGDETGEGSGAGFGLNAQPAGVFILKDGEVTWKPALDVNKVILGGQVVAVAALLVARSILRRHLRKRR